MNLCFTVRDHWKGTNYRQHVLVTPPPSLLRVSFCDALLCFALEHTRPSTPCWFAPICRNQHSASRSTQRESLCVAINHQSVESRMKDPRTHLLSLVFFFTINNNIKIKKTFPLSFESMIFSQSLLEKIHFIGSSFFTFVCIFADPTSTCYLSRGVNKSIGT